MVRETPLGGQRAARDLRGQRTAICGDRLDRQQARETKRVWRRLCSVCPPLQLKIREAGRGKLLVVRALARSVSVAQTEEGTG